VAARLSDVTTLTPDLIATARLTVETGGPGFTDITREAARFLAEAGAGEGMLTLFIRHTSASLVIQENADPDVQTDLVTALERVAPANAGWVHDTEGPDDMPAHVKTMLTGVSLNVPVTGGASRAAAPARSDAAVRRRAALESEGLHPPARDHVSPNARRFLVNT
jgi:secondary thiamine-phosphate synthase enzyme